MDQDRVPSCPAMVMRPVARLRRELAAAERVVLGQLREGAGLDTDANASAASVAGARSQKDADVAFNRGAKQRWRESYYDMSRLHSDHLEVSRVLKCFVSTFLGIAGHKCRYAMWG
jgi:hypothetical protein